ncbi:MAG: dihydrofolate reductase family protein [Devosia sp.]|nr:dihydrofolate reductase family protein [Devosia sp.]
MRDVVLAMYLSLDGYIEGPDREFTAPRFSPDLKAKWIDRNLERADLMMYGRTAYEGMAGYWTSPLADKAEAAILAAADKLVFSTTLKQADWGNVRIVRGDLPGEMARLKARPGRDMVLFGGAGIAGSFLRAGLVDELSLLLSPLLQGGGKRLFEDIGGRTSLEFMGADPFDSGAVLLTYRRG